MKLGMFDYSEARVLASRALDYRGLRQDMISSNISNADTPFYRPRDINFEQVMAKEAKKIYEKSEQSELKLAKTAPMHMDKFEDMDSTKATIFYRDGHLARNDGNSVDLDIETSELSKNGVMYNALIEGLKKHGSIMKMVIESSRNI